MNNAMKLAMMSRGKDSRREEHRDYDRDYDRREHRSDYDRRRYDHEDYDRDGYGRESRHYDRRGGHYYPMEYRGGYESGQDYRPRYSREDSRSPYRDEEDEDEYSFKIKGKFGMRDEYARAKPEKLTKELTKELAEKWVSHMDRADGRGKGGQWTMEQTNQLMKQKGYDFDPAVFYVVCNMLHSDYSKTLSKYGISTPEAYAELAKDWIEDDDVAAGDKKTICYYEDIVK